MESMNLNWYGQLTTENVEQVADLLRQLLNKKRFAVVISEGKDFQHFIPPNLKPGQKLKSEKGVGNEIIVHYGKGVKTAHIQIFTSCGLFDLQTPQVPESPFFTFEDIKVAIQYYNSNGDRFYLQFAPEFNTANEELDLVSESKTSGTD